ncbi:MAG: TfoX/Sxy family protein [Dermatophilaceae bacterium]
MIERPDLALRVHAALGAAPAVREVKMFGGVSFMVNEKMALSVMSNGDLLVRTDPERADVLLAVDGARPAEMGVGRSMGKSWITVAGVSIATDEALRFWVDETLAYNAKAGGSAGRRRPKKAP